MNNFEGGPRFSSPPKPNKLNGANEFVPSSPYFKFQDSRLQLALPRGELESSVTQFMREIGLEFPETGRTFEVSVENMPIDFVFLRASSIPEVVFDERAKTKAGITGSDIVWEKSKKLGIDTNYGETIPLSDLVPDAPQSRLFCGITDRFLQKIKQTQGREPQVADLSRQRIVTKYPNITQDYFADNSVNALEIYEVAGTDEAYQYAFPNINGLVGIINTGQTLAANNISVVEEFYKVSTKLLQADFDQLSTRDMQILTDLREMTWLALQKRGMV